jgi:hypothetical protein
VKRAVSFTSYTLALFWVFGLIIILLRFSAYFCFLLILLDDVIIAMTRRIRFRILSQGRDKNIQQTDETLGQKVAVRFRLIPTSKRFKQSQDLLAGGRL